MVTAVRPAVRRRQILESDLEAVAILLSHGFRLRPKQWWLRGLTRQAARPVPEGYPRFGYMLECEDRPVGVLLMIFSEIARDGVRSVRCNLSSWHVEPGFAAQAPLLLNYALRDKSVTYINVSPAPHVQPIIEAQGFRAFSRGLLLSVPALQPVTEPVRLHRVRDGAPAGLGDAAERDLLEAHAAFGCTSLVVEARDGLHPFVFAPRRVLKRLVPTTHLVYSRDLADFVRFSGALGRYLLRRAKPTVLLDVNGPVPGLVGRRISQHQNKYYRGPNPPRLGELAYTEGVIYGP
ncbi:hypothetical protein OPKNFCMD_0177 [Methylobacterium crusticola]|uniref:Acyl-CoA acyltransferase n=1 Tax=Methylobacterium crusticola TaxID=1697972 RepID=A0ABQ4QR32_9HYPH|nr:hypothetical protein [Methylobacterium crusticola]GJD47469.1 hypothetical protein OPKNFCMD_0177 [Methylobacterium crusticola]